MNRHAEALSALEKAQGLIELRLRGLFAYTHARAGRRQEALRILAETTRAPAVVLALVYTGLGQTDQAFECLEKAYKERHPWLVRLKTGPLWDPLRSDPRFDDLLKRLNLR